MYIITTPMFIPAGKSRLEVIEEAVQRMIQAEALPADFEIKGFEDETAWGMSEDIAVIWDAEGLAYKCNYLVQNETPFMVWNEDEQHIEKSSGYEFNRNYDLDIVYYQDNTLLL